MNSTSYLSETERSELCERLASIHRSLNAEIDAVHSDHWYKQREAGIWSPAEIAEHIVLVESSMLRRIEGHLDDLPDPNWEVAIVGKREALERVIPSEGKIVAPPAVSTFEGLNQEAAVRLLTEGQQAYDAFLIMSLDRPLKALVWPHSLFGHLNVHLWLLYLVLHSERHLRQFRREARMVVHDGSPVVSTLAGSRSGV